MRSFSSLRKYWLIPLLTGLYWPPSPTTAQDIYTDNTIEEIVVTTRKREENLQEVPISIGVFSADDILRVGIRDLRDLTKLSPSLQFDKSYSQNSVRVTIRGLSNTRGRSNVAFLVDGIDVTSETTGTNAGSPMLVNQRMLTDVERIEVVRGPQSALYGRAAFAGAINYVSKNPADEFDFNVQVDVAQHDQQEVFASVSGPITDTLGFRLTGLTWNDDGYYKNVVSGNEFGGGEGTGLAGTLLWEPADTFSLKTRLTYTDDEYAPGAVAGIYGRSVPVDVPQEAIDAGVVTDPDDFTVDLLPFVGDADGLEVRASEDPLTGGEYPGNTMEVFRASLILSWEPGDYTFTSYSGYTDADMSQRYDLDRQAEGRPDTILGHGDIDTFGNTRQFSQEFRLASNWENSPVQMTLGLQYWNEERDDFSRSIAVTCRSLALCGPDQTVTEFFSWQDIYAAVLENSPGFRAPIYAETDHRSAYVMLEWGITDTVSMVVEDRFVREDFDATIPAWASCLNPFPFNASPPGVGVLPFPNCDIGTIESDSVSSSYQTPKVTLEWQITDAAMMYGLIGKGVKPAGISLVRVPVAIAAQPKETYVYDPEKMWSYEIGAKTQWVGRAGTLLLNGAAFYQDYTDKQTNTQQAFCSENEAGEETCVTVGVVTNASSAWVTGFELESNWITPLDGLSLGLGYTWLDSEYDDFKDATRSTGRIAAAGDCSEVEQINGRPHCVLDLSGNRLEFMPEHALVLTGRYENDLFNTGMLWFLEGNASYQSERYTGSGNFTQLDDFWLADARLGLTNDNWNIMLYVENLFDDDTISSSGGNTDVAAGYVATPEGIPGVIPPTLPTAFLPPPRTAGMRVQYQYR